MKKKSSKGMINLFDSIVLFTIIAALFFSSALLSTGYFENNANQFSILKQDSNMKDKELQRCFALLADDVCDDCDDDDVNPSENEKPIAIIYEVIPNPAQEYQVVSFLGYGEDSDGEIIRYVWESSIDGIINDVAAFDTSNLSYGVHEITFSVQDNLGAWSDPVNLSLEIIENQPPSPPIIGGQGKGKAGEPQNYDFVSIDPNGNNVYYFVEWGDGELEEWTGPFESDEAVSLTHTWDDKGSYVIRAKAKDAYEQESDWETMEISMPLLNSKDRLRFDIFKHLFDGFTGFKEVLFRNFM